MTDGQATPVTPSEFDIAIVGGGMAGASLICQLAFAHHGAQRPLRILLLERFAMPTASPEAAVYQPSYDARSTALSYGTRVIYEQMAIWETLADHVAAIDSIHVSDKGRWGSSLMTAEQENLDALGYVVENHWLGRVLLHRLQQADNVTIMAPAEVQQIATGGGHAEIKLADGSQIHSQLLVIADGADSKLAAQLGIETEVEQYDQLALIGNVSFSKPHAGRAYERFTDQGPIALLPLPDSEQGEPRSALVWTLPQHEAEALQQADEVEFLQCLQQRFGFRQGHFTRVGKRLCYPLRLTLAKEQVRANVVVLGNAAHTLHPVAGQGYNLVLRDVTALSQLLLQHWRQHGCLPTSLPQLQAYVDHQQQDQWRTVTFSDVLPKLFGIKSAPVELARGLGLIALDLAIPAKSEFVRQAAGLNTRLSWLR